MLAGSNQGIKIASKILGFRFVGRVALFVFKTEIEDCSFEKRDHLGYLLRNEPKRFVNPLSRSTAEIQDSQLLVSPCLGHFC